MWHTYIHTYIPYTHRVENVNGSAKAIIVDPDPEWHREQPWARKDEKFAGKTVVSMCLDSDTSNYQRYVCAYIYIYI